MSWFSDLWNSVIKLISSICGNKLKKFDGSEKINNNDAVAGKEEKLNKKTES